MPRIVFLIATSCIVALFLLSSVVPAINLRVSSGQQTCPSNEILRWTEAGGAPNAISLLTGASDASPDLTYFQWYGVEPTLNPDGSANWNQSVTDWVRATNNYTQWTFNVKPGLKWSNGQNVNASDILATYSDKYAFNATYDFTGIHSEVSSSSALNSSAAVFNLNKPDAHFAETISQLVLTVVLPAATVDKYGPAWNGFGTTNVTGPFYESNYQANGVDMIMLRNPYYYTTGNPEPKICEIDVHFAEAASQVATYLESDQTDLAQLDPSQVSLVEANPYVHVLAANDTLIQTMDYNITQYPLNITAFRQALVYGINESAIVQKALSGWGDTAYSAQGTIPPTVKNLYNPNQMKYNYNTSESLALLKTIGITKGSDGHLHYPNGTAVSLTIWSDSSMTFDDQAANVVTNNLEALGIQISEQLVSYPILTSLATQAPASLYISQGGGVVFPVASVDALPGWDVYTHPAIANTYWEYPPSADAQYQSNLTGVESTNNATLVDGYLNNIQALNAKYLPVITLTYDSYVYGYNTQHWTNWVPAPQGWIHANSGWADIEYYSITPTSSSSTGTTSQPTGVTTSSTSPTVTTSSSSVTFTSTSNSGLNTTTLAIIAIVVVIVLAAVGFMAFRRRPQRAT